MGEAGKLAPGTLVILNLSGRGDKDMLTVASALDVTL
jgi:tryptophan synthase beta chain